MKYAEIICDAGNFAHCTQSFTLIMMWNFVFGKTKYNSKNN